MKSKYFKIPHSLKNRDIGYLLKLFLCSAKYSTYSKNRNYVVVRKIDSPQSRFEFDIEMFFSSNLTRIPLCSLSVYLDENA